MEEEIFKADRCDPQAHRFVARQHLLQRFEQISGTLYEEPHHPIAAFDASDSAERTNCGKIGSRRQSLQLDDLKEFEFAQQCVQSPDSHEPSFIQNTKPIAKCFCLFHVVRRVKNGVAIIAKAAHEFQNFFARLRIDTGRWLVQQNEFRPMHQRDRQVQPPLHPSGVFRDAIVAAVLKPDELEQLLDSPCEFLSADIINATEETEILGRAQHRIERDLLRSHANHPADS